MSLQIRCLFGLRKEVEVPELMVAWDEHSIDANCAGFDEDVEKAKKSWGDELVESRLISIHINEDELVAMFEEQELNGKISKEEE